MSSISASSLKVTSDGLQPRSGADIVAAMVDDASGCVYAKRMRSQRGVGTDENSSSSMSPMAISPGSDGSFDALDAAVSRCPARHSSGQLVEWRESSGFPDGDDVSAESKCPGRKQASTKRVSLQMDTSAQELITQPSLQDMTSSSPLQRGASSKVLPEEFASLDETLTDHVPGKKSSVASSSMSKSSTMVFHKAVEEDRHTMERSLLFLRRALLVVSLSSVCIALTMLVVSNDTLGEAVFNEGTIRYEGDRMALHSVRSMAQCFPSGHLAITTARVFVFLFALQLVCLFVLLLHSFTLQQ